jgi:hypothetical protein
MTQHQRDPEHGGAEQLVVGCSQLPTPEDLHGLDRGMAGLSHSLPSELTELEGSQIGINNGLINFKENTPQSSI